MPTTTSGSTACPKVQDPAARWTSAAWTRMASPRTSARCRSSRCASSSCSCRQVSRLAQCMAALTRYQHAGAHTACVAWHASGAACEALGQPGRCCCLHAQVTMDLIPKSLTTTDAKDRADKNTGILYIDSSSDAMLNPEPCKLAYQEAIARELSVVRLQSVPVKLLLHAARL